MLRKRRRRSLSAIPIVAERDLRYDDEDGMGKAIIKEKEKSSARERERGVGGGWNFYVTI